MIEKLADLFEKLIPAAAVISLITLQIGGFGFIVETAPTSNGLAFLVMALLMFVFWISSFGLLAMLVMMHRHLKSIESKLDLK